MRPTVSPRAIVLIRAIVIAYALAMLLTAWLFHSIADASPLGMLLAFAPRWWLLLPWLVLVPVSFAGGWQTSLVALSGLLAALFGVAQFELPAAEAPSAERALRLVTYNTDLRSEVAHRIRQDLRVWDADLVLLQDCKTIVADSLRAVARTIVTPLAVHVQGRFCLVSRWPLRQALDVSELIDVRSPNAGALRPGDSGMRYVVRTPVGDVPVYSVHLTSPRDALGTVRWLTTTDRRRIHDVLQQSINERSAESAALVSIVRRERGPVVIGGDFNLPYGSATLQRDWGEFTNAFAHAGLGLGYTMQAGVFPVRIDHVLVSPSLVPLTAEVLTGHPSEHQPLVVTLQLEPKT